MSFPYPSNNSPEENTSSLELNQIQAERLGTTIEEYSLLLSVFEGLPTIGIEPPSIESLTRETLLNQLEEIIKKLGEGVEINGVIVKRYPPLYNRRFGNKESSQVNSALNILQDIIKGASYFNDLRQLRATKEVLSNPEPQFKKGDIAYFTLGEYEGISGFPAANYKIIGVETRGSQTYYRIFRPGGGSREFSEDKFSEQKSI
jgi:hypothetical protein